ncbi:hypothetical protein GS506_17705 [Rhodococcus hoagii]|nr:hypothetical protein [Prescottella equi]NKS75526.1 hypothetical protein [Prescottella equi]
MHQAQESWTAKIDVKASIVLALDGAVLVAIISGHGPDGALSSLAGWRDLALGTATLLILIALLLAVLVVRPALGSSRTHRTQHRDHVIYFGHLRHWDSQHLATRLRTLTPTEQAGQIALQLVAMSKRNWWKHRLLQWSLYTTAAAATLLAIATLWPE